MNVTLGAVVCVLRTIPRHVTKPCVNTVLVYCCVQADGTNIHGVLLLTICLNSFQVWDFDSGKLISAMQLHTPMKVN